MKKHTYMIGGFKEDGRDLIIVTETAALTKRGWITKEGPRHRFDKKVVGLANDLIASGKPVIWDGLHRAFYFSQWGGGQPYYVHPRNYK